MPDYKSYADQYAAQRAQQNDNNTSELFRALMQQKRQEAAQMAMQQEREAAASRETEQNKSLAEALTKKYPKAAVGISAGGGVSINPENDMSRLAVQETITAPRLETKALQDEYSKLTGGKDTISSLATIKQIRESLKNPSGLNSGAISSMVRNMVESGVATDKDIERFEPLTARKLGSKLGTFIGYPKAITPYSEEQIAEFKRFVDTAEKTALTRDAAVQEELRKRGSSLAPYLSKTGKLPGTIDSLGGSRQTQLVKNTKPPKTNPLDTPTAEADEPSPTLADLQKQMAEMEARRNRTRKQ